ncbi:MAG: hypothetical protein Hals2KO_10900 [Halioglobus sp.]
MKVYIHIGWPKTGTSAIQSHIFVNRGWFESRGVLIPKTGYASGLGHAFLAGADSLPTATTGDSESPGSTGLFEQLAEELKRNSDKGFHSALISSEGLALVDDAIIEQAHEHLGAHEVTLLAYVRDQLALYQSATLQEFETLLNTPAERFYGSGFVPPAKLQNYDFAATLSRWSTLFGDNLKIRVRLYQRDLLKNQNVVFDFLDCLDLEPDDSFWLSKKNVNHSLDMNAAAILLIAREAGMPKSGMLRLSRALSTVAATDFRSIRQFLNDGDRQFLRQHFDESNKSLMRSYPPENADHSEPLFGNQRSVGSEQSAQSNADTDSLVYLRAIHRALATPEQELWDGGLVAGFNLGKFTGPPNTGWRGPEADGVWSVGPTSELAFKLPDVHPTQGPSSIRLVIAGVYFEGNTATKVTIKDNVADLDLTRAVLTVALDDTVKKEGVKILLEHQHHDQAEEKNQEKQNLSFKLRLMAYDFVWA